MVALQFMPRNDHQAVAWQGGPYTAVGLRNLRENDQQCGNGNCGLVSFWHLPTAPGPVCAKSRPKRQEIT